MRTVITCSLLLWLPTLGFAGEGFEKKILGTWVAESAPNRLLSRLVIAQDAKSLIVEVWAVRGLKEEAIHKAPLHLLRAGIGEKGPVERALATWKVGTGDGEATLFATLGFKDGNLVLDLSKVYQQPNNANWFTSFLLMKSVVNGRIVDPAGKPVEGATITVSMRDGPNRSFTAASMKSGKDGKFSIGLNSGEYDFVAAAKGNLVARTKSFTLQLGQTLEFGDLRLATVVPTIPDVRSKK